MNWQAEMVEELKAVKPTERNSIFKKYMERTGRSKPQLYRDAREAGFTSGRSKRSDAGKLKSDLTEDQIEFIAALIHTTAREVKGPIMPVERALEIAVDNGVIDAGQISASRLQQILTERNISRAALKVAEPSVQMRSLHPNHVHVFDVSVCIQYYLKGKKGLAIMDERDYYKNKPQNFAKIKTRLMRYVLVDHFSGAFYLRYFNSGGETQDNLYQFLIEAWSRKEDERHPFRGVPFIVLMDQGAANTSRAVTAFLKRLNIEIPPGAPYSKQRQGAVEVMHNIIEGWFESGLKIQPVHTVEDLNNWAQDWSTYFNATRRHTRHGMTRTQSWLLIKKEQLRELPGLDILTDLYAEPEVTRTVTRQYMINFRGEEYNVKHIKGIIPGRSIVKVVLKPFSWPEIDVLFNDTAWPVSPITKLSGMEGGFRTGAPVIGQEFKAPPETLTQQAKKRFDDMAYGEKKKKNAVPFEGVTAFGHHADKVTLNYIEKKGTAMEVDRAIVKTEIPITQFLKDLSGIIGQVPKELNKSLREKYGSSINVIVAEEVMEQLSRGEFPEAGKQVASLNR